MSLRAPGQLLILQAIDGSDLGSVADEEIVVVRLDRRAGAG